MKLFVIGATGQTGSELLKIALGDGHQVTAFVRSPQKIKITDDNLTIVQGDLFSSDSIEKSLPGHEAVISCLGFPTKPKPVTGYLDSAKCIISAMRKCEVKRLITITAWWTDTSLADEKGSFFIRWLLIPIIRPVLDGMKTMEDYLRTEVDDINYTVVRPPGLTKGERTKKTMRTAVDKYMVGNSGSASRTARADVADFMLSCLNTSDYDRAMVAIAY